MRTNRTIDDGRDPHHGLYIGLFGIFLPLYVNLRAAAGWLQDDIKIMVYLDERLVPDRSLK